MKFILILALLTPSIYSLSTDRNGEDPFYLIAEILNDDLAQPELPEDEVGFNGEVGEFYDTDHWSSDNPRIDAVVAVEKSKCKPQNGLASWYGGSFQGRPTSNGEIFNTNDLTAANRDLPMGTKVRVTNKRNGLSVVVRINDRGPFKPKRVIDLSHKAAAALKIVNQGVGPVRVECI